MILRPAYGANEARRDAARRKPARRALSGIDKGLAVTFGLLLAVGLITLYAASYYNAQDNGGAFSEVLSQLMGVGVGGIPATNTEEYKEFRKVAGSFGYDIFIDLVSGKDRTGKLTTSFGNSGIAPFYYDWDLEYRIVDAKGTAAYRYSDETFRLSTLLPGETKESVFFIPDDLKAGEYTVQMRFVNPAEEISKKVMPLRLSNDHEIRDGFYELARITIE